MNQGLSDATIISLVKIALVWITGPLLISIFGAFATLWLSNKKKHDQNLKVWNQVLEERRYHPPHGHNERKGPLTAEGITTSPLTFGNGKG